MNSFLFHYAKRELLKNKFSSLRFILAVMIGVGTISGINSYKNNLRQMISKEARNLLGGDLVLESGHKISKTNDEFIKKSFPAKTEFKKTVTFSSMLSGSDSNETSISRVKAIEKGYPFFGEILTEPADAWKHLKKDEILLDDSLAKNLKLELGSSVQVGEESFKLAGYILKEPGSVGSFMGMAPSSILLYESLKRTNLEQKGSRIQYHTLVKLPSDIDSNKFKEQNFKEFIKKDVTIYHNTEIGSGSQRFIRTTFDYLSLLGLSSFFLGCISILLSSRASMSEKMNEISVVKCLGADNSFYGKILFIETISLSLIGTILGFAFGYFFQFLIPNITGSELLGNLVPRLDLYSICLGLGFGLLAPIFLILESYFRVSALSPLRAIREETKATGNRKVRLAVWIQIILLYSLFFGLGFLETQSILNALVLAGVLLSFPIVIFLFYLVEKYLIRVMIRNNLFSGVYRMTLAKLSRPRSGYVLPVIGIGSALTILFLSLSLRNSLLALSGWDLKEKRANLFVMDLRKEQLDFFNSLSKKFAVVDQYTSTITGARLIAINGGAIKKEETEKDAVKRDWRSTARVREYFLTYRDKLYETEKIERGKFWEEGIEDQISVEKDFASNLGVKVGDRLTFNVQGIEIEGKITNLRSVNWSDMKPNFVVIFSPHSLKEAPAYYISSLTIDSSEKRYEFQKSLVKEYPNVLVIDIEKAVSKLSDLIIKISGIINLMSYLLFGSSLLLLLSAFQLNQKQRDEETRLLKLVGADSSFLTKIYLTEALYVALLAFASSLFLSLIASLIISDKVLNVRFDFPILEVIGFGASAILLVVLLYLFSAKEIIETKRGSVKES
ncbi:MAG: FtsX-like permease family protein [Leptospiraceae bacterium]|nr:FtsX-like permease family protein [Leptospiraceae bacterium]